MESGSNATIPLSKLAQQVNSDISQSRFRIEQPVEEQFSTSVGCAITRENQDIACYNLKRFSRFAFRIDDAIRRGRRGTYGICIDCQQQIPQERIDEVPAAKRCVHCQANHENGGF